MAYDNPINQTITLPAAALSADATLVSVVGPAGKVGRLEGIGAVVTTDTTGAATELRVGSASDADAYGTLSVPIATAGAAAAYNGATISDIDANLMPADTAVLIASDGGSNAGAADVVVTIAWF